ncbi:MAG: molybdopterin cofactor-binding domain-containing protein, partial [Woeseiaceae bacterium]
MDARAESRRLKLDPAVGQALPHDSAHLHVTGQAAYTDDLPEPRGLLHVAVGMSSLPHARVEAMDLHKVLAAPGVRDTLTAPDIPGENNFGPIVHDDPILVAEEALYAGHPLFAVAADTVDAARKAALLAEVDLEALPAIFDPVSAVERESFVLPTENLSRGDAKAAIDTAKHRISGRVACGGQDQFYLEGHIAMAVPQEDDGLVVYSSTQHPDEVRSLVAGCLGREAKNIVVICRRMGGAFGGKESQAALIACIAALMADKTGRACKLRLNRDDDMIMTGKRHDFVFDYDVGFDDSGRIQGVEFEMSARCGISADLSGPVCD